MKIRIAFFTDIPKIIEVAALVWKQTYRAFLSDEQVEYMYARMYNADAIKEQMQQGCTYLLYQDCQQIQGFAAYEIKGDVYGILKEDIIYLHRLYVRQDIHKKGVGSTLLQAVENVAHKNHCPFIQLNVHRKNPAMYFYKKMGFELYEKTDIAYGHFWLNDYILRKKMGKN